MSVFEKFNQFRRKKSVRYGLPFLIMMVGGSFGLREFTQLRYQFAPKQAVNPEEMKKIGVKMKDAKEVTIDKVYDTVKTLDIDNWDNKRGPRPWEE